MLNPITLFLAKKLTENSGCFVISVQSFSENLEGVEQSFPVVTPIKSHYWEPALSANVSGFTNKQINDYILWMMAIMNFYNLSSEFLLSWFLSNLVNQCR